MPPLTSLIACDECGDKVPVAAAHRSDDGFAFVTLDCPNCGLHEQLEFGDELPSVRPSVPSDCSSL